MASFIGSFILNLFGIRQLTQNFIPLDDEPTLEVDPAYFTVTNDDANQRNVLTFATLPAPTFGNVTVGSLTYAPGYDVTGPSVRYTSTDASPHALATIPIPGGSIVDIDVTVLANLGTNAGASNVNAPIGPAIYRVNIAAARTPSGSPAASIVKDSSGVGAPFILVQGSATSGCMSFALSGNNLLIQVNGFAAVPWVTATAYVTGNGTSTIGSFVTSSGNVYVCTTSGTSSGSAPSGTGTSGTGAVFTFVCVGSVVPVQWTMGAPRVITG